MENSSNTSLPSKKCMKCREKSDILLSPHPAFRVNESCAHIFCQRCFKKENETSTNHAFKCPCCHMLVYENIQSIDEAILLGEASTLSDYISPRLEGDTMIAEEDVAKIHRINNLVIEKLEIVFRFNPTNFNVIYFLFLSCMYGHKFLIAHKQFRFMNFYTLKLFDYSFKIYDHPTIERYGFIKMECCHELTRIFHVYHNYPTALKYAKLAYEHCLRSSHHDNLQAYKGVYIKYRADFTNLPPLRFAVGDEIEFLHELETGSEWKQGKVVEFYYRERDFDISFSAPYRLQLLDGSTDMSPVYAWVKADLDRYVRKVGVRSIEDTRYQARLDAKVEELEHVYCSNEFIHGIYCTLSQDHEFVEMLQSVWQIELSELMLSHFRILVMHRQPLVRTNSGYHAPSSEEVIAGIKAYFDPAHRSEDAPPSAYSEDSFSQWVKLKVLNILRGLPSDSPVDKADVQGLLLDSIRIYLSMLLQQDLSTLHVDLTVRHDFTVPQELSEALSRVVTLHDIAIIRSGATCDTALEDFLDAWMDLHRCLENPSAGSACECPFVYFFVKFCLDHGTGVPKLALALYDRMNLQLSREFIRRANATCELNRLDQSTGQVKFKNCSRCKAVIYCSRECQTAHYPEHKKLCMEHATG